MLNNVAISMPGLRIVQSYDFILIKIIRVCNFLLYATRKTKGSLKLKVC